VACLDPRLIPWQLVRAAAKRLWGEAKPDGQPVARWLFKCQQCVGYSMKAFVREDALSWDAYIIGTITMSDLKHFLPQNLRGDAVREMHR